MVAKMWILVNPDGIQDKDSLSTTKVKAIGKYIYGWMTKEEQGWKCIKVNVTITPL